METIILLTIFGVFILFSYTLGLKNGQKIKNNESISLPNLNPIEVVKNIKDEKAREKYENEILDMIEEIDNYGLSKSKH